MLELGSGLGFTGLVVCQNCRPKQFTFTDCHKDVVDKLKKNIALNIPSCASSLELAEDTGDNMLESHVSQCCEVKPMDNSEGECQSTSVRVVTLDWELVTEGDLEDLATGEDVILAAGK